MKTQQSPQPARVDLTAGFGTDQSENPISRPPEKGFTRERGASAKVYKVEGFSDSSRQTPIHSAGKGLP
jgi:hypothetical protein